MLSLALVKLAMVFVPIGGETDSSEEEGLGVPSLAGADGGDHWTVDVAVLREWGTRWRWQVLLAWTVVWSAVHVGSHGFGWHFFVTGSRFLFSHRALHLYAANADLQSGPLSFVSVAPLTLALPVRLGETIGIVAMAMLGLVVLQQIEAMQQVRSPGRFLILGLCVVPVWAELSVHWSHPDDVLALLVAATAVRLQRSQHFLTAALLLGIAVDCKPWAIAFAPLVLMAPQRQRLAATALCAAAIGVVWLPFVLSDLRNFSAVSFQIRVSTSSVIHLFGVRGGTPHWIRPAQVVIGGGLALIAVLRRRWYAVLLVGVCVRMLLDPATKNYYEAGLVVAAAIYDLAASSSLIPVMTSGALVLVYLPSYVLIGLPVERAYLRLVYLVAAPILALTLTSKTSEPAAPPTAQPAPLHPDG